MSLGAKLITRQDWVWIEVPPDMRLVIRAAAQQGAEVNRAQALANRSQTMHDPIDPVESIALGYRCEQYYRLIRGSPLATAEELVGTWHDPDYAQYNVRGIPSPRYDLRPLKAEHITDPSYTWTHYLLVYEDDGYAAAVGEIEKRLAWERRFLLDFKKPGTTPCLAVRQQHLGPYTGPRADFTFRLPGDKDLP